MLKHAARASATGRARIDDHVQSVLRPLWQKDNRPKPVGLAISGGVDSMALATICRRIERLEHGAHGRLLTGFIVDHTLRRESGEEAVKVAAELDRLGVEARILTLDWSMHSNPAALANFETVARRLRYRAIGSACHARGITDVLVAHHADDQAETLLVRMLSGYTGTGLKGMLPAARIPACEGIYGVDASGEPRAPAGTMRIESGGVWILRPLLPFTKDQLIDVCREAGTDWVEDPTNAVPGITSRNTIRYMQRREMFPAALRRERLLAVTERVQMRDAEVESQAKTLFDRSRATLNLRLGALTFDLDEPFTASFPQQGEEEAYRVHAALLRRLLRLIAPTPNISLQELDAAVDYVFSDPSSGDDDDWLTRPPANIAGVHIRRASLARPPSEARSRHRSILLHRGSPPRNAIRDTHLGTLRTSSTAGSGAATEWRLWDSRYWMRVVQQQSEAGRPVEEYDDGGEVRFLARYLTPRSLGDLRRNLQPGELRELQRLLHGVSSAIRATLPVVFAAARKRKTGKGKGEEGGEVIVALPTLGWSHPRAADEHARWVCEVRYRDVDFAETALHSFVP